jgi:glutamate-1-semialdehyde 2,1-aminomutase
MSLSKKLFARARLSIPGGVNSPVRAFRNVGGDPFFVRRAKGCRIWDVDGREMIDFIGTWGPAILGHAPNCIIEAVHTTAKDGVSFGIPNPLEIEMAELICSWVPSVEKVRMVNSGTEATMSAIRLARGHTGRNRIIKFEGCYHGHVDSLLVAAGSGALTHGEPDSAGVPSELAALTITLPFNDPQAVEDAFAACGEEIAAIIVEPIPANAGLILPAEGYLAFLREITTRFGALLIFDEVMTGFRVARGGVQELYRVTPDLTALGKVIGGGLPVGAFGGKAEIMDSLAPDGPVYQAGTLSGNPLALAAGLTQLKELAKNDAWSLLEARGATFEQGIRQALAEAGLDFTFHRVGSMFCLFFRSGTVRNLDDVTGADMEHFRRFFWAALEDGVYFAPSPYETGFLSTAHSEEDLLEATSVAGRALTA